MTYNLQEDTQGHAQRVLDRRVLPNTGNMRYCGRCGTETHGTAEDQPHLCADIAKRLARRERQVAVVEALIQEGLPGVMYNDDRQALAFAIVAKLAGLGVADD